MIAPADILFLREEVTPETMDHDALNLISRDHARQIKICDILEDQGLELMERLDPAMISAISTFLREDLPHHIRDEEHGLFPLLKENTVDDGALRAIIKQLQADHEFDEDLVDFLLTDLDVLARGHKLANPQRLMINIQAFVRGLRRHIDWEESVVMPLARRVLKPEDLRALGQKMIRHRWVGEAALTELPE